MFYKMKAIKSRFYELRGLVGISAFLVAVSGLAQNETLLSEETRLLFQNIETPSGFLMNKGDLVPLYTEDRTIKWNSQSSGYVITNPVNWKILYESLKASYSSLDSERINFFDAWFSKNNEENTNIPIGIIDLNAHYLQKQTIERYAQNVIPVESNDELLNTRVFAVSHLQHTVYGRQASFHIDPKYFLVNRGIEISSVEIDFDDGHGYSSYSLDEGNISINYPDYGEKSIKYKISDAGKIIISYSKLLIKKGTENLTGTKVDAPITMNSSARTLLSDGDPNVALYIQESQCDGGIFDKPILLVEGFDILENVSSEEMVNDYMDLGLWTNLEAAGYDLVGVDFHHNHDGLEHNAQVLADVIKAINRWKERGNFETIIIGESMGGVLTKMALSKLEDEGYDHQCGLYISFDAPHNGANIPLSLQQFLVEVKGKINGLGLLGAFAEVVINVANGIAAFEKDYDANPLTMLNQADRALKSRSAKELLIRHYSNLNHVNATFLDSYNRLKSTSFPSLSRNIALVSGSNGEGSVGSSKDRQFRYPRSEDPPTSRMSYTSDPNISTFLHQGENKAWFTHINMVHPAGSYKLPWNFTTQSLEPFSTMDFPYCNKEWDMVPGGYISNDGMNGGSESFTFIPTVSAIALTHNEFVKVDGPYFFDENAGDTRRTKSGIVQNNLSPFDDIYAGSRHTYHVDESEVVELWEHIEEREIMHQNLYLQDRTITTGMSRKFEAENTVDIGHDVTPSGWEKEIGTGDFVIQNGATVSVASVGPITLKHGFKALTGSSVVLRAKNTVSGCSYPGARSLSNYKENGYRSILPKPSIVSKFTEENGIVYLTARNYLGHPASDNIDWQLKGEGVDLSFKGAVFSAKNLPSGQYSVKASIDGAVTNSKVFSIDANNILNQSSSEMEFGSLISFYPNPSKGTIKVYLGDPEFPADYKLFDLKGTLIDEGVVSQFGQSINLKYNQEEGVYILKVNGQKNTFSERLILE